MTIAAATSPLQQLARGELDEQRVMTWTCPVPYFGRLRHCRVATVGINPSNREFVDAAGCELDGAERRFPTLRSLRLDTWADASSLDVTSIVAACDGYFDANPYTQWFDTLDAVVRPAGASYYSDEQSAAHIDLVPFATEIKWGALARSEQRVLLRAGGDVVVRLLQEAPVELLILNGASVVRQFEHVARVALTRDHKPEWDLRRRGGAPVPGTAYTGVVDAICGAPLGRSILVVGFNHNLQSSFGVTKEVVAAISKWVADSRL
jgi:hypothetical protein